MKKSPDVRAIEDREAIAAPTLRVTEIYKSIQGESTFAGRPCVFIRLTGCSLRCVWCDTAYAFEGGEELEVREAARRALALSGELIEITGGEPLEQEGFYPLAGALLDAGRTVLVETGGHVLLDRVDPRVIKIVDWKAPGSGMERENEWRNIDYLNPRDEIKIVVSGRADFDWALERIRAHRIFDRISTVLISPVWQEVQLPDVAGWVKDSGLPIRLNLPLHKIIWGDKAGV